MRKTLVVTFVFFLTLFMGIASAAELPEKGTAHIYDTAGMIPKDEIKTLEQAAGAGDPYSFYVLTVESLENSTSESYAEQAYKKWSLHADDVLILLSKSEHRIQLYFENAPLQKKLDALPQNYAGGDYAKRPSIDRFIGKNFTPLAKKGDFGAGLLKLIDEASLLPTPKPEAPVSPTSSSVHQSQPSPLIEPDVPLKEPMNVGRTILITMAFIIGALFIGIGLVMLTRYNKRTAMKRNVLSEAQKVSVDLLHQQEMLKPLLELYSGPAADQKLVPLAAVIDRQAEKVQKLIEQISSYKIVFFSGSGNAGIEELSQMAFKLKTETMQTGEHAIELVHLDKTNSQEVNEVQSAIQALEEKAKDLADHYLLSLGKIKEEIKQSKEKAAEIYKAQISDLIDAPALLETERDKIALHHSLLDSIPDLLTDLKEFPDKIYAMETDIKTKLEENQLKLVEFNPYERTASASETHKMFADALKRGDLQEAQSKREQIREVLEVVNQMIPQRLKLRASIEQDMEAMRTFMDSFSPSEDAFNEVLQKLERQFHESVWSDLPARYQTAVQTEVEMVVCASNVNHNYTEQRYNEARKQLNRLMELSTKAQDALEDAMQGYKRAAQRLEGIRSAASESWSQYQSAENAISFNSISFQNGPGTLLVSKSEAIRRDKDKFERIASSNRISLDEMENLQKSMSNDVNTYANDVDRLVKEKQQAERQLRETRARYEAVQARTISRNISGSYSSNYHSNMSDINKLLMLGLYAEAINLISDADRNINLMQSAYDEIIREEQRHQEEERRRQEEEQRRRDEETRRQQESNSSTGSDSYGSPTGSTGGDNW
ncbi:TPM domain-containing protein [Paenibacillus sp. Y412MC10]|uniref:TPM domain-containing protein n=1 Tax=Geobacillus sp. (strain Y412MC10) TaxID=481743 RepID=UPI0011AB2ECA|nr:TPM domain-containing protein [Paenibacillus sp. Y412MC10]